jgi:hypothetical protein
MYGNNQTVSGNKKLVRPNGESWEMGFVTEEIALSTGGTTTDSVANMLPAGAMIMGVAWRVTQAIATATAFSIGDATTAGRFKASGTQVGLGQNGVGIVHLQGNSTTNANGPSQAAAAKLRVTTTGTPSAGKIRITVFYQSFTSPTS